MKKMVISALLLLSSVGFAKELKRTVIATDIRQGAVVDVSNLGSDKISMFLNKGNFGDEPCRLRFFSYGPSTEIRGIWFATIYNNGNTPSNWSVYEASNSAGQKFKLASYADVSKLNSDSRVGVDLVCWE